MKFLQALNNILQLNRPAYSFLFSGGEPTAYPWFFELLMVIVTMFDKKLSEIRFVTNASRELEFYERLAGIAELAPISMQASIHTDHVKPDHIYELINKLAGKVNLTFSLMHNPACHELACEIFIKLCELRKERHFDLFIAPVREPPDFTRLD